MTLKGTFSEGSLLTSRLTTISLLMGILVGQLKLTNMFVHCRQCAVKAHLPNGRYVIEVVIPARKKKAIKNYIDGPILGWVKVDEPERRIKALSTKNFHFRRFYTLRELQEIDASTGIMKSQWFIGPCVTR